MKLVADTIVYVVVFINMFSISTSYLFTIGKGLMLSLEQIVFIINLVLTASTFILLVRKMYSRHHFEFKENSRSMMA